MTKPVTIPNTFAGATTAIPLSQLDGDFNAVASAINDARTYSNYAADSGSVNAFSITLSGITTTYTAGLRVQFKAANANTGACTIDVNNQGAKNIVLADGSTPGANVIVANSIVDVIYDGTSFQLLNDAGGPNERIGNLTVTGNLAVTGTTSLTGNATIANTAITLANVTTLTGSNATFAGNVVVSGNTTIATSVSGVIKATSGVLSAATAGTDYVAPATATTFTATQTFSGSSSALAIVLNDAAETATISATAATGTINYDVTTQSVLYYTTNASANWTVNFRGSSGTSLNTLMSTGQSITVAFLVTQGSTAYYNSAVEVDGSSVTPKYQGGTAWTAGNASSIDAYTYTIVKTGNAAFTVFASQTKFA